MVQAFVTPRRRTNQNWIFFKATLGPAQAQLDYGTFSVQEFVFLRETFFFPGETFSSERSFLFPRETFFFSERKIYFREKLFYSEREKTIKKNIIEVREKCLRCSDLRLKSPMLPC